MIDLSWDGNLFDTSLVVYCNWRSFSLSTTSVRARSFSLSSIFIFPLPNWTPSRTPVIYRHRRFQLRKTNTVKRNDVRGRLTSGHENLFRPSNCIFLSGGSHAADSSSRGCSYPRLTGWWMSIFSPTIPAPISRASKGERTCKNCARSNGE